MTDDRLNLVRAKINLELSDYRQNGDRRHLAIIAEMMAMHIGTPDAGEEIKAIMLSEKNTAEVTSHCRHAEAARERINPVFLA